MPKFLTAIDMVQNAVKNLKIETLSTAPTSPVQGQIYLNTTDFKLWMFINGGWKDLSSADITKAELASIVANSSGAKLVGVSSISGLTGANVQAVLESLKTYVDSVKQSLDIKDSVRVATTVTEQNIDLDNAPTVIDGVSLIVGNRVLVKDGAYASGTGEVIGNASSVRNGLYRVSQVTPVVKFVRTSDADSDDKVNSGLFVFIQEGNVNADSGFVLSTNETIVLGSTSLSFSQFSGAGQITAGLGLTKNGNVIDVGGTAGRIVVNADSVDIDPAYVGQDTIEVLGTVHTGVWQGTEIGVAYGGTGATTAQQARINLGATTKFAQNIGNGTDTSFVINHQLGSQDIVVMVRENGAPTTVVNPEIYVTDANNVTVTFATAPAIGQYRVIIIG